MLTLYYAPGACSLASHIALIATGLDHKLVKVDLKAKRTETGEDFKAINPKGYVPALTLDDGETLTENVAVLLYIGDAAGKLVPAPGLPRWRVIETTAFVSTELHKNFKPFFDPTADDAAKAKAREMIGQRLALMEDRLGDRAFIVGEDLSVADCYLFVMLTWCRKQGIDAPAHLAGYYDRLARHPAFAQALSEEGLA